jgi:tartrate dehydratase alpha subunit/fumarate hydratase class I-like protein
LGQIIESIAILIMGIAVGYIWRDRISQARRAKERERRERKRQQAEIITSNYRISSTESASVRLH